VGPTAWGLPGAGTGPFQREGADQIVFCHGGLRVRSLRGPLRPEGAARTGAHLPRSDAAGRKGLAAREPRPNDRRYVDIVLTAGGRQIFDELLPVVVQINEQLLSGLTDAEGELLDELFARPEHRAESPLASASLPLHDLAPLLHFRRLFDELDTKLPRTERVR
jgi:DNA-binding MarR family transcriptional regulator